MPIDVDVIDRLSGRRQQQLVELFSSAWWTAERRAQDIIRMLAGTDVLVALVDRPSDRLVGFARAITDGTFLAVILDVIVDPHHRGTGLGARLMNEILSRPELAAVESIELVCQPDLVDFYRRWGFTDAVGGSRLMRRTSNASLLSG